MYGYNGKIVSNYKQLILFFLSILVCNLSMIAFSYSNTQITIAQKDDKNIKMKEIVQSWKEGEKDVPKENKEGKKEITKEQKEENKKEEGSITEELLTPERKFLLYQSVMLLGFGGVMGFITGFAIKKTAKVVMICLGLFFVALQGLSYLDMITIHWEKIKNTIWPFFEDRKFGDQLMEVLTRHFPYAGGFSGGFILGFKKG